MSQRLLTDAEATRFGRNVLLPEIGLGGQETLRGASVRIDDLGAVGSACALYLACAGIGALEIDDARPVAAADLAGTLYRASDVGRPRGDAARAALRALDSDLGLTRRGEGVRVSARDLAEDRCTVSVHDTAVIVAGGPGPQALLAGALAAAEVVKLVLGLGAPIRAEALP